VIRGCIAVNLEAPVSAKPSPDHFSSVAKASLLFAAAAEHFSLLAVPIRPRKRLSAIAAPVKGEISRCGRFKAAISSRKLRKKTPPQD